VEIVGYNEHRVPLEVEYVQTPAQAQLPIAASVDFTRLLQEAGRRGLVDLSSIRVEAEAGPVPAQFSPADDLEAAARCAGRLIFVGPRPRRGSRAAARFRGHMVFGATDDLEAPRLPYPPRSYRHTLPDGRAAPVPYFRRMQFIPQPQGRLDVVDDGRLVTTYHYRPDEPKPYLYPLIGPAGRGLTRLGHPHDAGETHSHHHSVWAGYRGVNGENFWEERKGGRLLHQGFERMEDGPLFARFVSLIHWNTQAGKLILRERRDVTVYAGEGTRLIDFTLHFQGAEGAIVLDKTSFGFLAVRVAKSMGVFDGGGVIRNSEGGINEPGVFWKPARWCDYSGPVMADDWNGIGFLDHPSNPHHPTPWHVRPDGWMGAAFATQEGHTIPAGQGLELRYRLYVHAGDAKEANVEAAWHDYAHPPRVTLGALSVRG
jgi:methane monooxygenase PmoA-like